MRIAKGSKKMDGLKEEEETVQARPGELREKAIQTIANCSERREGKSKHRRRMWAQSLYTTHKRE